MERIAKETVGSDNPDEINISDLVKFLYRGKILILIVTFLCSFMGFYYAYFFAVPKYQATAIFNIQNTQKPSLNLDGLDTLALFSGIQTIGSQSENILDQVNGADFLRKVVENERLYLDQEFFINPSQTEKNWLSDIKTYFKRTLGLTHKKPPLNQTEVINTTVEALGKSFAIKQTKNGAYELSFFSNNAAKAAFLANTLMNTFLEVREESLNSSNQKFLSYLQETLTNAKRDLDEVADRIESFMLARNMLSEREFTIQAGRLKEFREKIQDIEKNIAKLVMFESFMNETTPQNPKLQIELNKLFALAPQLKSLIINKSNGDLSDVKLILQIVRNSIPEEIARRKKSLEATTIGYNKLARRAKINALDARELSELSREVEAKQLIFESVAQQIGTNRISDGFQKSMGNIYQTAREPTIPIKPKRTFILTLSTVLGLFLGSFTSLVVSSLSKKVWTVKKMQSLGLVNNITEISKKLYKTSALRSKSSVEEVRRKSKFDAFKLNKLCFHLDQMGSELPEENKFLCLIDFGHEPLTGISPILGTIFSDNGKKVMLLDVTYKNSLSRSRLVKENIKNKSEFLLNNVSYERLDPPLDSSNYIEFRKNIESLKIKYSQSHDYIITIVDKVESENTSMLELFTNKTLLFITKAGQLNEYNISSIRSIINEKLQGSVFIIFFNN